MKFKNLIRIVILVPLATYLLYCCYHFITNEVRPTYLDCGKVISKSSDEVAIKHGVRTELYLNIEFEKAGFKSIECEPTTYFQKQIGEKVCFQLDIKKSNFYNTNNMIGACVLTILAFVLLVFLCCYLTPDSWF